MHAQISVVRNIRIRQLSFEFIHLFVPQCWAFVRQVLAPSVASKSFNTELEELVKLMYSVFLSGLQPPETSNLLSTISTSIGRRLKSSYSSEPRSQNRLSEKC